MGVVYPVEEADIVRAYEAMQRPPANLFEAAQNHLLLHLYYIQQVADGASEGLQESPSQLAKLLEEWKHEVEEILVHVFDLLYFYGPGDTALSRYIKTIWTSWSVIPNIRERVPEYVLRTLCAALTHELRHGVGMEERARARVSGVLRELLDEGSHNNEYVSRALAFLESDWNRLLLELPARRGLVQFASAFMYSAHLATKLQEERRGIGAQRWRVDDFLRPLGVNGLHFIENVPSDENVSFARSMWMWNVLAFSREDAT